MVSRRFFFSTLGYLVLITLTIIAILFTLEFSNLRFTIMFLIVMVIIEFVLLLKYINRSNIRLYKFINEFPLSESNRQYRYSMQDKEFSSLIIPINRLVQSYSEARMENERQYELFQIIIENLSTGIMVFENSNLPVFSNLANHKEFSKLKVMNYKHLNNIVKEWNPSQTGLRKAQPSLININNGDSVSTYSILRSDFSLNHKNHQMITIHDVTKELEFKEYENWTKLIRVLNHEIRNSLTPICSLSSSLIKMVDDEGSRKQGGEDNRDAFLGSLKKYLLTINSRSHQLSGFISDYKSMKELPPPNYKSLKILDHIHSAKSLFDQQDELTNYNITIAVEPEDLIVYADETMIIQVLINLIKNAIEACRHISDPVIHIRAAECSDGMICVEVQDNGAGINPEHINQVFIPFFTTKSGGTGIGLGLSRQIMHLHDGNLSIKSIPGEGTTVTLSIHTNS